MNVNAGGPGLRRTVIKLGEVELEVFQGGRGPPHMFLHGAGGPAPDAPFLRSLCQTFQVIAPSHPGFGGSNLPFWLDSTDDYAHVYLDLIEHMKLGKVILVGASIGGWAAAEMATKTMHCIDRLILVGPVGIKVGPADRLDIPDVFAMSQNELNRLVYAEPEKWLRDSSTLTHEDLLAGARHRQTFALITWEPYMHNPKLKHRLRRIDRPTLVLRGAKDGLVSHDYAKAYADLIPGARLETIPGAGHVPHVEQPERFVEMMRQFVNQ
jgi:pimeloyl-ACP methyl ester carboxylesterase